MRGKIAPQRFGIRRNLAKLEITRMLRPSRYRFTDSCLSGFSETRQLGDFTGFASLP
jgi:hypothetical protein